MREPPAETIVVTGATSGIGREIAIQLSRPQRVIWLIGRDHDRMEEVAEQVRTKGGVPKIACMDLADLANTSEFLARIFPPNERVDAIYLAAAVTLFGEVKDMLPDDWSRIYTTNLLSPILWTHHFYSNMVRQMSGRIVLISSLAAYSGYPTATAYATMKAGLLGLYRSLLHEGKPHGVSIHLVSPGYIETGIYKSAVFRKTTYEKTMNEIRSMGFRILSAGDAAKTIIRNLDKGKSEFAFPAYASAMKWVAPRMPFLIKGVHSKIVKGFRKDI